MSTYQDLMKQIENLQTQAEELRKKELQEVIADVKAKIQQFGLTASDLGFSGKAKSSPSKSTVKAKYRDPATGNEWSGRGRAPKWLVEAEAGGKSRESFLI